MAARRGLLLALSARSPQASDSLTSLSAFSSLRLLSCCESGGARSRASLQSSSSPSIAGNRLFSSTSSSSSSASFSSAPPSSSPTARTYSERKLFAYPPNQVFDVVADVQHYDAFVPWCVGSTVLRVGGGGGGTGGSVGGGTGGGVGQGGSERRRQAAGEEPRAAAAPAAAPAPSPPPPPCSGSLEMEAELEVGFRNFSERYTSLVTLTPPSQVLTSASGSSLFRLLECRWRFAEGPLPARTTWVSFSVSFEFRSAVHRHLAGVFFDDVVTRMVRAFEGRCAELYGPSSVGRRRRVAAPPSSSSSSSASSSSSSSSSSRAATGAEEEEEAREGKAPA